VAIGVTSIPGRNDFGAGVMFKECCPQVLLAARKSIAMENIRGLTPVPHLNSSPTTIYEPDNHQRIQMKKAALQSAAFIKISISYSDF